MAFLMASCQHLQMAKCCDGARNIEVLGGTPKKTCFQPITKKIGTTEQSNLDPISGGFWGFEDVEKKRCAKKMHPIQPGPASFSPCLWGVFWGVFFGGVGFSEETRRRLSTPR